MTFLQPFILWGLPLLFIPVVIHLLNRLRHRPQPWAAMHFLRAASQTSISQAKLRQILILIFRVLAVAALIFFLSRPLAGGWLGWALSPAPEVVVLVLDRSASMEAQAGNSGQSRREQAIAMWKEALDSLGRASRLVLIDSATGTAKEIPNMSVLDQPAMTGPTDTRADMPALLQRAYMHLTESKAGAAEVWIASDLQESNWVPGDAQWERVMAQFAALPQKVRFRLLSLEDSGARNVSVSLVEAVRRHQNGGRNLAITLDLQQSNPAPEPVILNWQIAGAHSQAELDLSGGSLRWRNNFPLPANQESGSGTIEIGADANAADNRLYFAYDLERAPTALIVTAEPRAARPLVLAASDLSLPSTNWAKAIAPEEFPGASLTNIALIVWDGFPITGVSAGLLEQFAASGGSVLVLPGGEVSPEFAGLAFAAAVNAPEDEPFRVARWNELEGPLAKTEEGFGVPVNELEVFRRTPISGTGGVMGTFSDGSPFLLRKAIGKGEVYFCSTSADPAWSSLDDGAVLVPMLQRMLLMGARRVNGASIADTSSLSGTDVSEWEPQVTGNNPRFNAGIYRVNGRFVAVNRPAAEDSPDRVPADTVRQMFSSLSFQMHQEQGRSDSRLQGEVWRAFVVLMLIFLLVEGLLILPPKPGGDAGLRAMAGRKSAEAAA